MWPVLRLLLKGTLTLDSSKPHKARPPTPRDSTCHCCDWLIIWLSPVSHTLKDPILFTEYMNVFWNKGTVWPWFLFNCCSPRAQLGPQLATSHPSQICQYHSIVPLSACLWLSHFNLPIQINPKLDSDICGWAPCLSTIGIWKLDLKLRRKKGQRHFPEAACMSKVSAITTPKMDAFCSKN